mmetsp:Transcript_49291/g.157694  ORF Transcript_49291/g.157694 Transcript_49291/m.157694 type:complete len:697 (+) Transcript_49291:76-2166(+)
MGQPDEAKAAKLRSWLKDQNLERHADKLMDVEEVGLASMDDLLELTDEDIEGIGMALSMNVMERKRLARGVHNLKQVEEAAQQPPPEAKAPRKPAFSAMAEKSGVKVPAAEMDRMSLEAAIKAEAPKVDQFEVVMSLGFIMKAPNKDSARVGAVRQGTVVHVCRERVLGADGTVWAELTSLELKRSADPSSEATRGFMLIDDSRTGKGLVLRGPLTSAETGIEPEGRAEEQPEKSMGGDEEIIEAAVTAFEDVPDHADLYEVCADNVQVLDDTFPDAKQLGMLQRGMVVHCHRQSTTGHDGRPWMELTNLELWRSCEPLSLDDRGFVVQNTAVGMNIKGPLNRDVNQWLRSKNTPAGKALATQRPPKPFASIKTYAECFEVAKNIVFVKKSPSKGAASVGTLRKGQTVQVFRDRHHDAAGQEWVELTSYELWHSCNPEEQDRGFALIDGSKMGLGTLLRGPLTKVEVEIWQDEVAREQRATMRQKQGERAARIRDAEEVEQAMKNGTMDESTVIYTYVAMKSDISMKLSEDPRHEWVSQSSCIPGGVFYSTGMEWRGPNGEKWINGYTVGGQPRWLLAEDPLLQGGQYLVEKSYTGQHMYLKVHYFTVRGVELFETFIDSNSTVRALKERFSNEVSLNPAMVRLMKRASATSTNTDLLADRTTLSEAGVTSSTHLFVEYDNELYSLMMVGRACGWL